MKNQIQQSNNTKKNSTGSLFVPVNKQLESVYLKILQMAKEKTEEQKQALKLQYEEAKKRFTGYTMGINTFSKKKNQTEELYLQLLYLTKLATLDQEYVQACRDLVAQNYPNFIYDLHGYAYKKDILLNLRSLDKDTPRFYIWESLLGKDAESVKKIGEIIKNNEIQFPNPIALYLLLVQSVNSEAQRAVYEQVSSCTIAMNFFHQETTIPKLIESIQEQDQIPIFAQLFYNHPELSFQRRVQLFESALAHAESTQSIVDQGTINYYLGLIYLQNKEAQTAKHYFTQVSSRSGEFYKPACFQTGKYYMSIEQFKDAEAYYLQYLHAKDVDVQKLDEFLTLENLKVKDPELAQVQVDLKKIQGKDKKAEEESEKKLEEKPQQQKKEMKNKK